VSATLLGRQTLLERAPTFTLTIDSAGDGTATVDGVSFAVGAHALEALAAFREPRQLGDVVDCARVTSARDLADLIATIMNLVERGLLRAAGSGGHILDPRGQWTDPRTHVAMLDDVARTSAFLAAIQETVREDDVVVDIGTGTGVLAVAAANAGARKTYAIEASAMASTAAALCVRNGVSDRVEVLRGWSSRVTLPERATVMVTETLGSDPLEEHILSIALDAKKRLLVAGARVIPAELRIYGVVVEVPTLMLERLTFTAENTARWTLAYGVDFSSLADPVHEGWARALIRDADARTLLQLSEPRELWRIDLANPSLTHASRQRTEIVRAGNVGGVLVYFEATLSKITSISTAPHTSTGSHWQTTLWHGPAALRSKGDIVEMLFEFDGARSKVAVAP